MLSFEEFFAACSGVWRTERIYHYPQSGEVERSHTEFRVSALEAAAKQKILLPDAAAVTLADPSKIASCPGFAIAFETRSETGEKVAMSLSALFIPSAYVAQPIELPKQPIAAQLAPSDEVIAGIYLRDEGYSEAGSIAGQFTYQPTRQTLEMTTYYRRSVAVDQMRLLAPTMRMRTIVTYQRPAADELPTTVTLVGFGLEHRQVVAA